MQSVHKEKGVPFPSGGWDCSRHYRAPLAVRSCVCRSPWLSVSCDPVQFARWHDIRPISLQLMHTRYCHARHELAKQAAVCWVAMAQRQRVRLSARSSSTTPIVDAQAPECATWLQMEPLQSTPKTNIPISSSNGHTGILPKSNF